MNFVDLKGMVWPNGRTHAILFYGPSGWKARVWYTVKQGEVFSLGSGPEVFNHDEAEKKLKELNDAWASTQKRKR
jgi:hypothetical protein